MDEMDFFDYIEVIWRRKRTVACITVCVTVVVFVILLLVPRTYKGQASLIFPKQDRIASSGLLAGLAGSALLPDLGLVGKEAPGLCAEILKSRTIKQLVIDDLGLGAVDVDPAKLQKRLIVGINRDGGMTIECLVPSTWAKSGKVQWVERNCAGKSNHQKSALLAAEMTNCFIHHLQEFDREHSLNTSHRNRVFLEGEVSKTREQLSIAEDDLRKFKEAHPLLPPPDASSQRMEQAISLRTRQLQAEAELREDEEALRKTADVIASQKEVQRAAETIEQNPVVTELKSRLAAAEVRKAQLLEDMTERHPDVVAVNQEIENIRRKIEKELPRITATETMQLNPVRVALVQNHAELQIKREGVKARLKALDGILRSIERDMSGMAKDQMRYVQLERDAKALETVYTSLLTQLSQARVSEAKEPDGFAVLDWAAPEKMPSAPRTKLLTAVACLLSFFFGSFVALAQEGQSVKREMRRDARRQAQGNDQS